MGRVQDKIAIVTGAARGIGEAVATMLAREGAQVFVTDLDAAAGESCVQTIRAGGGQAEFLSHDVTREQDWERVTAQVLERCGRLDVLVNNAGIGSESNAEQMPLEEWRRVMAVNLDSVYFGTRFAIGAMRRGGGGSIVNIASVEAMVGHPQAAAYNAAKGGVRTYTKSAALHCARDGTGIRVNSVHPGFVRTPMLDSYLAQTGDPEALLQALVQLHPLGRLGRPEDVAWGVLYLASDESRWVTGSELVIDGGFLAQ